MTYALRSLLKKYNLHPRKGLGQNFLDDPLHLAKIVDAAELTPDDTVLEVGPGLGTLTRMLAEAAGQVIAVELDPNMVNLLKSEFGHFSNLTIIEADILNTQPDQLLSNQILKSYKVVANLPYYITSAVIRHLLESKQRPQRLVVTIQKEVAQRIVAQPGKMSVLAVSVQFYGEPAMVHHIPAGAFYPSPKVDSAVLRIDTYALPPIDVADVGHFFRVVKAGFSQKRKQLKNSLAAGLRMPVPEIVARMDQANIAPKRRAETLSLEEWGSLAELLL